MAEGSADGHDSEKEGDGWNEPPRANGLACHVGRDLKEDVGDVEDRENDIVVVARKAEVLLETCELGVANVGAVDKAEEV